MLISELLADIREQLGAAGIPDPRVDAELLVAHVLGFSRGGVQAQALIDSSVADTDVDTIVKLVKRRAAREPLQHLTGTAPFRSLELAVGPGVFVPRPETETVAQFAIDALRATWFPEALEGPVAVDLGTGSGAIALAMASEVPHARVFGVEVSPEAFAWAAKNFARHANATVVLADLADALSELDGTVAVVASNPPYIPLGAVPRDPEVRLHDPELALYGGAGGLDIIQEVSITAKRLLYPGGMLVLEHGELQAASVADLLRADGWTSISSHRDLLGRDRATTAVR
jgi:release factor glutamine methyltransferase